MREEKRHISYIRALILPLGLAFLFVFQNLFSNFWLGLYAPVYAVRLALVTFALGVVLYGPALLLRRNIKFIYLIIVSPVVSILFIAQFLYFRYSESFLQFSSLKYFWQVDEVSGTVVTMLSPGLIIFLLNIFLVILFFAYEHKNKIEFETPYIEKIIIIIAIGLIVFAGYKYLLYKEKEEWGSTSQLFTDVYDFNTLISKIGTINFSIEDAAKFFMRSNLVTENDKVFLRNYAQHKVFTQSPKNYYGQAKGKNLIIIQVESLENVVLNTLFYGQEIAPNLNNLAKEGLYFNNYYAQAGPGNTADAEFSTMTSLYPLPNDVVFVNYAKNKYKALPQILKESGYKTFCFHGDAPSFWNRSNIYPMLGYEKMYGLHDFKITRPVGKGPSALGDEDLFSQTIPKLKELQQPFMANVITMSMHTPFILPADLQTLKIPEKTELNWLQWEYLQSVHYTDNAINNFIIGLKENGLYENSLIVIIGDHNSYTNVSSVLKQNNSILDDISENKVPFILLNSGIKETNNIPGSHLDFFPTIANLFGIEPPATILGQDLLNTTTPVVLHNKIGSGKTDTIVSNNIVYKADKSGEFIKGSCYKIPEETNLPITNCQQIHQEQTDNVRASNIIIKGDLLDLFWQNLTKPTIKAPN